MAVIATADVVMAGFGTGVSDFSFLAWIEFEPGLESFVFCFGTAGAVDPPAAGSAAAGATTGVGTAGFTVVDVDARGMPCFGLVAAVFAPSVAVACEGFPFAELGNLVGPSDETSFVTVASFSVDDEDDIGPSCLSFFTVISDSVVVDFSPTIPLTSLALLSAFS